MDSLFSAGHEFTAWRLNDSTIGKRSLSDVKNGIPVEKDEEESKFKGTSEFVETI